MKTRSTNVVTSQPSKLRNYFSPVFPVIFAAHLPYLLFEILSLQNVQDDNNCKRFISDRKTIGTDDSVGGMHTSILVISLT